MVLAVNAWDEDKEILMQYAEQAKLSQRILLNGGDICDRYSIPNRSIPTLFWIDRAGIVVDVDPGSGDVKRLEENTKKLVGGKS